MNTVRFVQRKTITTLPLLLARFSNLAVCSVNISLTPHHVKLEYLIYMRTGCFVAGYSVHGYCDVSSLATLFMGTGCFVDGYSVHGHWMFHPWLLCSWVLDVSSMATLFMGTGCFVDGYSVRRYWMFHPWLLCS